MNRRSFLSAVVLGLAGIPLVGQNLRRMRKKNSDPMATSRYILSQAFRTAYRDGWNRKPIGECMGNLGMLFLGTAYVGGTLEGSGPETCRIDLTGLDCVTFFENVLGMARVVKLHNSEKADWQSLQAEVTRTRYRGGVLGDYTSRLHYTADWIRDNIVKNTVEDITPELGGIPLHVNVGFMSANPRYYQPLANSEANRATIAAIEKDINSVPRTMIPGAAIAAIESRLRTGDIVAIVTSKAGLDYAHTGMIAVVDGVARFLHASQQKKKVVLDVSLSKYVGSVRTHTGVTILRPLEPRA